MTVTVISVGGVKEEYLARAIEEYKKRLSLYAKVDEVVMKEEKIQDEDDASEVARALEREGETILRALPRDAYKVALCVEGVQFDSVALAKKLEEGASVSGKIALVIGSSHGLSEKVKRACDLRLSVSKLTFPHQLMRALLFEILYRSFTIMKGKRYHK
jgi:23S rRNA (pseudouridine1915-N3)-methyltransferase